MTNKIIYWITTILFSLIIVLGAINFITNSAEVGKAIFEPLGYPAMLVVPLGIAKILGITALLVNKFTLLKRLAYYGLLAELLIAFTSHLVVGVGEFYAPLIPFVLGSVSFIFWRKMSN